MERLRRLVLAIVFLMVPTVLQANTLQVDPVVEIDGGDSMCSLIEALENAVDGAQTHSDCAAGSAGSDSLVLAATTYQLTAVHNAALGFNGLPSITNDVVIEGNGAILERSALAPSFRHFHVASGGRLELSDLWIRGGMAVGGSGGGGGAGLGGAVANEGILVLERCTLSGNDAVGGLGAASPSNGHNGGGGVGGNGGLGGSAAGGGGGGEGAAGGDGDGSTGGGGGGDSLGGAGADGAAGGTGGQMNGGTGGSFGGGGANGGPGGGAGGGSGFAPGGQGGSFAGGGGSGINASGGDGGFAGGGGNGSISGGAGGFAGGGGGFVSGTAGSGGFGGGNGGFNRGGGGAGLGGAIYIHDGGAVEIRNSTLSGNRALGGGGFQPGQGLGGAIFNRNGSTTLQNVTLAANTADAGGAMYNLGDDLVAGGAGNASVTLTNSIFADSVSSTDCVDGSTGSGSTSFVTSTSLVESAGTCPAPAISTDPALQALLLNAPGLTPTHALPAGSAARGQGSSCLLVDQRGIGRSAMCDLGAFELTSHDLTVTQSESIDPVIAGSGAGNLVYVVQVTNQGPDDATSLEITEALVLPAGTSVSQVVPSNTTSYSGGLWTVGSLPVSSVETLTVALDVGSQTAAGAAVISSSASISAADGDLLAPMDDSVSDSTSVTREIDLVLSQTESADPVSAGSGNGNLEYVVTLQNTGPSDASSLSLAVITVRPPGVTLDTVTPNAGSFSSGVWAVPVLSAGQSATLTLVLTVGPSASPGVDLIQNGVTVTGAGEVLINTGDDTVSTATSILGPPIFEDEFETGDLTRWTGQVQ